MVHLSGSVTKWRGRARVDPGVQCINALRLMRGRLLQVRLQALQIPARTEQGALTGNDHRTSVCRALGQAQGLNALGVHLRPQRIAVSRVGNGQNQRLSFAAALEFGGYGLVFFSEKNSFFLV